MTLDDDIDNLARIPLFSVFEPSALRMLAFSAETRLMHPGDVLFRRGETSDAGYILTMGSITLDDSRHTVTLSPWTLIGETALITSTIRSFSAVAGEPSTVLRAPRLLFLQILEHHPETAARAREFFRKRLAELSSLSGAERQRA